jgi:adenine-specific DNA-methyltransferase
MTSEEKNNPTLIPKDSKIFFTSSLSSSGYTPTCTYDFEFEGKMYKAGKKSWRTNKDGMMELIKQRRIIAPGDLPCYILYHNDFPIQEIHNLWDDTHGASDIRYVVQTSNKVIQRCLLMTTDPGDLVVDPTCGSGTTAFIAEQFGRRWITIDTSRIAFNIAKQRMMTAIYPYYKLYDDNRNDIRQGFKYKSVNRVTLGSIANKEEASSITLFDQPTEDSKLLRVSGPFHCRNLTKL